MPTPSTEAPSVSPSAPEKLWRDDGAVLPTRGERTPEAVADTGADGCDCDEESSLPGVDAAAYTPVIPAPLRRGSTTPSSDEVADRSSSASCPARYCDVVLTARERSATLLLTSSRPRTAAPAAASLPVLPLWIVDRLVLPLTVGRGQCA